MRLTLAIATALSLLTATTAGAQQLSGMGANLFGNYFDFRQANLGERQISEIAVGGMTVKLQGTRLDEIRKRLGGTIMSTGDATWICYHLDGTNTWFMSNALGGQEFLMMLAVETSARMPDGCEAAGPGFSLPDMGVPGLGATTADLKERFGAAAGSKIGYRHDRPGGYSNIAQYIGYMMKSGKVVGYGAGEASVPATD